MATALSIADSNERAWMFPGWRVVVLAALGMVATLPGRTVGLGLITEPLLRDLAIERTAYANLTFWATILGSTFSFVVGPAIDRFGVRVVLPATALLLGATTAAMGSSVTTASLIVFLILSRGFGQSALSTASVTCVGKWFTSRLGIALGVFSALVALGFATAIPLVGELLKSVEWRSCWTGIGLVIGVLGLVTYFVMPRDAVAAIDIESEESEASTRWRDAMRAPAFWCFAIGTAFYYLVLSGLTLFNEAVIAELGFGNNVFIGAMAAMMGAGLIGNFVYGYLVRTVSVPRLLAANLFLLALVLFAFPWLKSPTRITLHAAAYGIVGGAFAVLFFAGFGKAFGQAHLGKIQGTAQVLGVVSSALGPKLLAETQASTGSFLPLFGWLAPIAIVLAILAWFTPMPKRG